MREQRPRQAAAPEPVAHLAADLDADADSHPDRDRLRLSPHSASADAVPAVRQCHADECRLQFVSLGDVVVEHRRRQFVRRGFEWRWLARRSLERWKCLREYWRIIR